METSQFKNLIKQLEIDADHAPAAYKKKIINCFLIGQIASWSIPLFLLFLCLIANLIAQNLSSLLGGLLFLGILFLAARIWLLLVFTPDPPQGHWLDEETAPKLYSVIEKIQDKVGGPKLTGIVLDTAFRLELRQVSRFGIFGAHRYYLQIGLPWLQALSSNQFHALLAHELSLFAETRGGKNARFYRQRLHWLGLFSRLQQGQDRIDQSLARFFRWYIPYLNACTIPFARRHTLRADRTAAKLAGASSVMHALCRSETVAIYLEEIYWPRVMARAEHSTNPRDVHPFADLRQELAQDDKADYWKPWLRNSLDREIRYDENRPGIKARIDALKEKPKLVTSPTQSAAEYILGDLYGRIAHEFDQNWHSEIRNEWDDLHRKLKSARELVGSMSGCNPKDLDRGSSLRYAEALLALGDRERGLPLALELAESREGMGEGAWLAAQTLLAMKDERALRYLEMVMNQSEHLGCLAAQEAVEHYSRHGQPERVIYFENRLRELQAAV